MESLREGAESGSLIEAPRLRRPLERWRDWGDAKAPQEWVDQGFNEEFDLIEFIDAMSSVTTVNWTTPVFYVDPRWLYDWVDEDQIEEQLDALDRSELTEEEREVIERYEEGKQKLEDGLDPSKTDSWIGF